MSLLSFTDEELNVVMTLASAVPRPLRNGFLEVVAGKLASYPPGARRVGFVHRLAAGVQRELLRAGPIAVGRKYR
jgi:hypothetical protein